MIREKSGTFWELGVKSGNKFLKAVLKKKINVWAFIGGSILGDMGQGIFQDLVKEKSRESTEWTTCAKSLWL